MSSIAMNTAAPVLRQSVKFGERYVSSALNRKLAGLLLSGIYYGYIVKPGGEGKVLITHEDGYSRSVAVVERDGYNVTVTMDDPGYVAIPASGVWYIVIEALYIESQPGYQRIVAREKVEDYHLLLAKVTVQDIHAEIDASMIDRSGYAKCERRRIAEELLFTQEMAVDSATKFIRHLNRHTQIALQHITDLGKIEDKMFDLHAQNLLDISRLEDQLFTLKSENTTLVTAFVALLTEFLRLTNRVTQDRLDTVNDLGNVREDTALQLTKIANAISALQATDVGTQHVLAGLLGEVIQLTGRVTKGQLATVGQDKDRQDTLLDLQRADLATQQGYVGLANNVVYLTDRVTHSQLNTLQDKLEMQSTIHDMMETGDAMQCFETGLATNLILVSDRVTQAQKAIAEGSALVGTVEAVALSSSGVSLGQLKLTPVTLANNVSAIPAGTALAFVLEEVDA